MKDKKKKRKNSIRSVLTNIIMILIIGNIIFAAISFVRTLNTIITKDYNFYTYIGDHKVEIKGTIEFNRKNNEATSIKTEGNDFSYQVDSTPLYYENEKGKCLFPQEVAFCYPIQNGRIAKIPSFSTASVQGTQGYVTINNSTHQVQNGFIYDGKDLYFFVEDVTLIIGNDKYELGPLSYIKARYNDEAEIYDYSEDKLIIVNTQEKDVRVENKNYNINLNTDSLSINGIEQLLLNDFSKIDIMN